MSETQAIVPIILAAMFLWLVGLTVVFYRLLYHYKRVALNSKGGDLLRLIDSLLSSNENVLAKLKFTESEIKRVNKRLVNPLQKISLVKFNPFRDMGGDHSFVLSLLNETDSGFILTGLHTRDRTRFYLKEVTQGQSKYELSKEEEQSLKKATAIKL